MQLEAQTISKEAAPRPVVPKAQKTPMPAHQTAKVHHISSAARHEVREESCLPCALSIQVSCQAKQSA